HLVSLVLQAEREGDVRLHVAARPGGEDRDVKLMGVQRALRRAASLPWNHQSSAASCVREVTPSFWNTLRRWYSTVRGLRNSRPAMSRFDEPSLTSRAICSSCGVSSSSVLASRLRAVSPL